MPASRPFSRDKRATGADITNEPNNTMQYNAAALGDYPHPETIQGDYVTGNHRLPAETGSDTNPPNTPWHG